MSLRVIPLFVAVLLLFSPNVGVKVAGAQVSDSDRNAIRQVIENQLAAFQRDDGSEAFSYASPGIQRRFGTPDNFMAMVRSGYAAVYRPRRSRSAICAWRAARSSRRFSSSAPTASR